MKPVVLLKPEPQRSSRIFTAADRARLEAEFEVVDLEGDDSVERLDAALPSAFAVVGHPDLDAARLAAAASLRAIVNVEGNFLPNVDYDTAFRRGIRVLGVGSAYAQAVAEFSLGLALDLARGITREDRAARAGRERYVSAGTGDSILLAGAEIALLGLGNLGRALLPLLAPLRPSVRVYDPWLPSSVISAAGARPAGLLEAVDGADVVFVLAAATTESAHLVDARVLDALKPGCRLVIVSRAAVVDFDALLAALRERDLFAAIDVWPEEPIPATSPFRELDNVVISPHRAGGIPAAFHQIGEMVVDDLVLMKNGLSPVRLQAAQPELVGRYRNRPVT
ncbi:MAG: NAD(P)-dependent oxidoreductase [Microbacterium sp.]|uniref:NAD(P)-dependent oxidoreductase n=1 Tax=Microbacterium sp. TaxID=51671 RepID=UPI0039E386DA